MSEIYYVDLATGGQAGPVGRDEFKTLFNSNRANEDTQVWYEGLAAWTPLSGCPDLLAFVKPAPARPAFQMPTTMPALKPTPQQQPQPASPVSPAGPGGGLFDAIAQRKAKMEANPNANPDANRGNMDHLNMEEDLAPKQTFAAPPPPEKKKGMGESNWQVLMATNKVEYYYNTVTGETTWTKPRELLSPEELGRLAFKWLWKPDDDQAFIPAKIMGETATHWQLQTEDGQAHQVKKTENLDQLHWEHLRTGASTSDLVLLDEMSLPLILHTLKVRFQTNQIYTNVGTILIALNPYKRFPDLYTPEAISQYASRGSKWVPPHVYLVASEALNRLLESKLPQSICISGESGAGKTECTKQALQYLAECAGNPESNVEHKILASNPILEAFGNAKTVRNNNSSRFGKYVEINFDHNMTICGSTNTNYLLEKVRVVRPNKGERNYHSFYQMLRGFSAADKNKYYLKTVDDYSILTLSGSTDVDGMDDVEEHNAVIDAMNELGWNKTEMDNVYMTLAAILHIGNIKFKETGDRKCAVIDQSPIDHCCELLKVDKAVFTKAVTTRVMVVPGQAPIDVSLGKDEAEQARDALAKFIYEKMFDWIVTRINTAIGKGNPAVHNGRACTIGILDIFGFEIFEHNQFEQLCINFTNEKLQQFFNQHTFKKEEEVYQFEGIKFDQIKYIDNQPMLDLIELKPKGILPLVDEEIKMPKGSDKTFVDKLCQTQKGNTYFKSYLKNPQMFVVSHYAGNVTYDSNGFLEKNRDRLNDDAYKAITSSSFKFLVDLFADTNPASRATLGSKFAKQLNDLMAALNATEPHYIRCIKPNPNKAQLEFHPVMVLEQLRYSGVFEAVKIRKMGFPFRYTHLDFWKRFKCTMPPTEPWSASDQIGNCKKLIAHMKQTTDVVQIGKTRILYRAPQHRDMELIRNLAVDKFAIVLQGKIRGWLARRTQAKCQAAQPKLQQAINTRTIAALESTIAAVGNLGFELYELTRAKRLIHVINEESRLEKLIAQLLQHSNVESQFDVLRRCVAEADDIELKSAVAEKARVIVKEIEDKRQARDWLVSGVAEADQEKCEWAVATAERLRMTENTAPAVAMIKRCKEETVLLNEIERCMGMQGYKGEQDNASFDPKPLRAAVDRATSFECKTKRGLALYADAVIIAGVRDTLRLALGTKNRELWTNCLNACKLAVDPLDKHPEIAQAREEVSYQQSVDEVTDALMAAVRDLNQHNLGLYLDVARSRRVDEIKYPVVPRAREILSKIVEARRLMQHACQVVDYVELMFAVQYAESFGYNLEETPQTRQLRDFVMQVCSDADYALKVMEMEPMKDVVNRAKSVRLVTPEIQQIEKWLASSEEKFVQEQLKCAKKLNDEPRLIRLTIQLKDLVINRQPAQFDFKKYGRLRNPIEWANAKMITLNRDKVIDGFHKHTLDTIHISLTEINQPNPQIKTLDNAKKLFKNLLLIMDERKKKDHMTLIQNSLSMCLQDELLQDEMVCQIIKQLTDIQPTVPHKDQAERNALALLHVWLEQFAPSEAENFLILWLRQRNKPELLRSCHLSAFYGGRKQPLSDLEIKRIMDTGKGLRDTNYQIVQPYNPPDPKIPPPGQACAYYQQWVAENRDKAAKKEREIQEEKEKMLLMGGQKTAATLAGIQQQKQQQELPPPPPPTEDLSVYQNKPLPPGWQTSLDASGGTYYWYRYPDGAIDSCWERHEVFLLFQHPDSR